jgi:FHS family L-fucose permease-like MFS transporter
VLAATFGHGQAAMWAILAVGLFNSIMFPTIFSMALHGLGRHTGQGSGILCMAIVGGAIVPFVQGRVADASACSRPSWCRPPATPSSCTSA